MCCFFLNEAKVKLFRFGVKLTQHFILKNIILTLKHGGGGVVV